MSTPSTTIITNLKNVTAPTANTLADADTYGMDMLKANELKVCLTLIVNKTDAADPNLATLNNILASLV
jgi:hypothetical protein